MLRRSIVALAVAGAVLVLAAPALAVGVHVRVEGETRTIFGPAQPLVQVQANPLDALETASVAGEFYYHVTQLSIGPYVDQIGRYPAGGDSGWVFKVNGASPPVGAADYSLEEGDTVLWYWAKFGPTGGPKTLALKRAARKNCYSVAQQDDTGKSAVAVGAALRVDGRSVRTKNGAACVGRHVGLVRATLAGAVRSNAVR